MKNNENLNQFREAYSLVAPKIEEMFGVSLENVQFRPMTKAVKDLTEAILGKDNGGDKSDIRRSIERGIGFGFYPDKSDAEAFVHPRLPENVYVNTYFHRRFRTKRDTLYLAAHELCHVASFLRFPELQDVGASIGVPIKKKVIEGLVDYLVSKVLKKTEYGPLARVSRFMNGFTMGHRFVEEVLEFGDEYLAVSMFGKLPETRREIRNSKLYLRTD